MSYTNYLGQFIIPQNDPDWPVAMTYKAEPPITVSWSMNPWETERVREIWLAEEAAWKAILPKQAKYSAMVEQLKVWISQLNGQVGELERTTGKSSGFGTAATYGTMVYSLTGGPYAWAAALAKMGVDMIVGIGTKKRAKRIMAQIEELVAKIQKGYASNELIKADIETLIKTAEGIRASQPGRAAGALAQSETAYQAAQDLDRMRADVLRERNKQAALLPRYAPGGNYAL